MLIADNKSSYSINMLCANGKYISVLIFHVIELDSLVIGTRDHKVVGKFN